MNPLNLMTNWRIPGNVSFRGEQTKKRFEWGIFSLEDKKISVRGYESKIIGKEIFEINEKLGNDIRDKIQVMSRIEPNDL